MIHDVPSILRDPRPIASVWFHGEGAGGHQVGSAGCTRIAAYPENGEYAEIAWVAVYHGDHLKTRFPAKMVVVFYQDPAP